MFGAVIANHPASLDSGHYWITRTFERSAICPATMPYVRKPVKRLWSAPRPPKRSP
jgi:hypothetical protein